VHIHRAPVGEADTSREDEKFSSFAHLVVVPCTRSDDMCAVSKLVHATALRHSGPSERADVVDYSVGTLRTDTTIGRNEPETPR
jgi:hypothetical protein